MRILGIDPGSQFMGLGCVEKRGSQLICIGHRLVVVKIHSGIEWSQRMRIIFTSITEAMELWKPNLAAIESIFLQKNASSALKLGQARGAAIAAIAMRNLPLSEFSPREVKQGITASGAADKHQVEKMVRLLLGASLVQHGEIPRSDSADALAVAICAAQNLRFAEKTKGNKSSAPLKIAAKDLR